MAPTEENMTLQQGLDLSMIEMTLEIQNIAAQKQFKAERCKLPFTHCAGQIYNYR